MTFALAGRADAAGHPPAAAPIPSLTGLRGLAALLVLLLHTDQSFPGYLSQLAFVRRGYLGVDAFFVLSGFIISHVYLRHLAAPTPAAIGIFLWHRVIRLLPVHAVILIALAAVVLAARRAGVTLHTPEAWSFADLPWHFAMVHAWGVVGFAGWNGPAWSISAEFFAYLLFPMLAVGLVRLPAPAALALGILALVAGTIAFVAAGWSIKLAWLGAPALVRVAAEFVCGACLYRALFHESPGAIGARAGDIVGIVGLAVFFVGAELVRSDFVLIAGLVAALIGIGRAGPLLSAVFAARPAIWLGEISYSIYLVHFTLLNLVRRGLQTLGLDAWSPALKTLVCFGFMAAIVAAAATLYYAIERPARSRLRNAFGVMGRVPARRHVSRRRGVASTGPS